MEGHDEKVHPRPALCEHAKSIVSALVENQIGPCLCQVTPMALRVRISIITWGLCKKPCSHSLTTLGILTSCERVEARRGGHGVRDLALLTP